MLDVTITVMCKKQGKSGAYDLVVIHTHLSLTGQASQQKSARLLRSKDSFAKLAVRYHETWLRYVAVGVKLCCFANQVCAVRRQGELRKMHDIKFVGGVLVPGK